MASETKAAYTCHMCLILLIVNCMSGRLNAFLFNPQDNPTDLLPLDAFVFVGETLKISCTHPNFQGEASRARFKIKVGGNESWFLPGEWIGNSTVQTFLNITGKFHAFNDWFCYKGEELLKSTKLYVEYPLIEVSNVSAFYMSDVHSYVHFSWSRNLKYYKDPSFVETRVFYSYDGTPTNWTNDGVECKANMEFCDAEGYSNRNFFYAFFEVSHKSSANRPGLEYVQPMLNTSVTSLYDFDLPEIRKTTPVTDVKLDGKNKTCVNLTWTLPSYFQTCHKCSSLYYQIQLLRQEVESSVVDGEQNFSSSGQQITVCDLTPNTQYTLSVRVKNLESNPWSNFSVPIQLQTDEDRPTEGPTVLPTGYHIERPCENDLKLVLVYWKNQPEYTIRGKVIAYEIKAQNEVIKLRPSSNYYRASLTCSKEAEVEIFTVTKVGTSLKPSTIVVPESGGKKDLVQFSDIQLKVEEIFSENREQKMLLVTWEAEVFNKSTFQDVLTFFTCEEAEPNTCFSEFETWKMAAAQGQILLKNISRSQNLFGYSLHNSEGQKTGIMWTDCVYQDDKVPAEPTGLQAISGEEMGSVHVMWYNMRCNRKRKVVTTWYNLAICPQNVHTSDGLPQVYERCQNVSVASSDASNYTFRNLKTGSYTVYLNAVSDGGSSPMVSTGVTTLSPGKKDDSLFSLISAVLCAIVFLAVLVVFCIRRCSKRCKKIDDLTIQTMKLMDESSEDTKIFGTDSDSGVSMGVYALPQLPEGQATEILPSEVKISEQTVSYSSRTDQKSSDSAESYITVTAIGGRVSLPQVSSNSRKPLGNIEEGKRKSSNNPVQLTVLGKQTFDSQRMFTHLKTPVVQIVSVQYCENQNKEAIVAKPSEQTEIRGAGPSPNKRDDGYTEDPSGWEGAFKMDGPDRDANSGCSFEGHASPFEDGYKDIPFLKSQSALLSSVTEDTDSLKEQSDREGDSDNLSSASSTHVDEFSMPSDSGSHGYKPHSHCQDTDA